MEFMGMDPEQAAAMQRQQEEVENHNMVAIHSIVRMVKEMPEVDLEALGQLISHIANGGPRATEYASYWQGIIAGELGIRFGRCLGCGKNHDKDLAEMSGQATEAESPRIHPFGCGCGRCDADGFTDGSHGGSPHESGTDEQEPLFKPGEIIFTQIGSKEPLNEAELKAMNNHGLVFTRKKAGELTGFVCLNCGISYVTIQDRMLREPGPEGCPGCIQKTKWG